MDFGRRQDHPPHRCREPKSGPQSTRSPLCPLRQHSPPPLEDESSSRQLAYSDGVEGDNEGGTGSFDDEFVLRNCEAVQRQPLRIIDWRGEICRLLGLEMNTSDGDVLEELAKTEIILDEEARRVRTEASDFDNLPPRGQIIYRINCRGNGSTRHELYLEEPWISRSGPYQCHLRAGDAIRNFELFLQMAKDISFIIYKDFECCASRPVQSSMRGFYNDPASPIANHFVSEMITIVSKELSIALKLLSQGPLKGFRHPDFEVDSTQLIFYPYLWWFHRRDEIVKFEEAMHPQSREHIDVVKEYFLQRVGDDWDAVDKLILKGRITPRYMEYLFTPETVMISKLNGNDHNRVQGAMADNFLAISREYHDPSDHSLNRRVRTSASIACFQWSFDGNFQRDSQTLRLRNIPVEQDKEFTITDLDVYPARYAELGMLRALEKRGEMFWKCRKRRYVCYSDAVEESMHIVAAQRFMVDIGIYKGMHPPGGGAHPKRNDLGPMDMTQEKSPLGKDFLLCLPTTIPGFNMQKKEWVTLDVGNIKDVEWNRDAFDMLVADEQTKELVRALVENHCIAEKNTDLISGKGNGLFILLHGAPGTGKTLTAETVAEIAEKPLYRVTCGDIGTKAEDVEKYLETVLLLGKTWGCVVLLDEADVFLEERTLFDLQRNALVSVFLRVLEYYEGILILTSNRVGIFDEAFKSRIQLTLRYKSLEEPQRKEIWRNLIVRLESHQKGRCCLPELKAKKGTLKHGVDFEDILTNLDQLAMVELNGRQIRNAISTARQLAMFRGKSMGFSHLKVVINESEKFDAYLKEVTGLSADTIQRDKGLR